MRKENTMERKDFLKKGLGLIGVSSLVIDACKKDGIVSNDYSEDTAIDESSLACTRTPAEIEGPFPYPGGEINNPLNRVDVTEGKPGTPLYLTFIIQNSNNGCTPVSNARVDIWHCDKDGYYSAYPQSGYLGDIDNTGKTFLRGYQLTNANGRCKFTTIYPGWYPGRTTHIHVEVFINGKLKETTQIAFPDKTNHDVYATAAYAGHGQNTSVLNNRADMAFSDSVASQLVKINSFSATAIYGTSTIKIPG